MSALLTFRILSGSDGFSYTVPLPPSPTWVQALMSMFLYSLIEEALSIALKYNKKSYLCNYGT